MEPPKPDLRYQPYSIREKWSKPKRVATAELLLADIGKLFTNPEYNSFPEPTACMLRVMDGTVFMASLMEEAQRLKNNPKDKLMSLDLFFRWANVNAAIRETDWIDSFAEDMMSTYSDKYGATVENNAMAAYDPAVEQLKKPVEMAMTLAKDLADREAAPAPKTGVPLEEHHELEDTGVDASDVFLSALTAGGAGLGAFNAYKNLNTISMVVNKVLEGDYSEISKLLDVMVSLLSFFGYEATSCINTITSVIRSLSDWYFTGSPQFTKVTITRTLANAVFCAYHVYTGGPFRITPALNYLFKDGWISYYLHSVSGKLLRGFDKAYKGEPRLVQKWFAFRNLEDNITIRRGRDVVAGGIAPFGAIRNVMIAAGERLGFEMGSYNEQLGFKALERWKITGMDGGGVFGGESANAIRQEIWRAGESGELENEYSASMIKMISNGTVSILNGLFANVKNRRVQTQDRLQSRVNPRPRRQPAADVNGVAIPPALLQGPDERWTDCRTFFDECKKRSLFSRTPYEDQRRVFETLQRFEVALENMEGANAVPLEDFRSIVAIFEIYKNTIFSVGLAGGNDGDLRDAGIKITRALHQVDNLPPPDEVNGFADSPDAPPAWTQRMLAKLQRAAVELRRLANEALMGDMPAVFGASLDEEPLALARREVLRDTARTGAPTVDAAFARLRVRGGAP